MTALPNLTLGWGAGAGAAKSSVHQSGADQLGPSEGARKEEGIANETSPPAETATVSVGGKRVPAAVGADGRGRHSFDSILHAWSWTRKPNSSSSSSNTTTTTASTAATITTNDEPPCSPSARDGRRTPRSEPPTPLSSAARPPSPWPRGSRTPSPSPSPGASTSRDGESSSSASSSSRPAFAIDSAALTPTLSVPAAARLPALPPSFVSARRPRHPLLLNNLARATLPTSSLSGELASTGCSFDGGFVARPKATYAPAGGHPTADGHGRSNRTHWDGVERGERDQDGLPRRRWSLASSVDTIIGSGHRRTSSSSAEASLASLDGGPVLSPSLADRLRSALGWQETEAGRKDAAAWLREHKEEVERYMKEEDKGASLEDDFWLIKDHYRTPKLPLVFCHGLFGFDVIGPKSIPPLTVNYWRGIVEILEENGADVFVTRVPASACIEERAKRLRDLIEAKYAGREINLIGHSMGGLDGRFLISRLDKTFRVRSLTTIATPHRGSVFADYFLDKMLGRDNLPALKSVLDTLAIPGGGAAFEDLTIEKMKEFNELTKDEEGVKYFSYGSEFEPGFFDPFRISHRVILASEGPNDGLVSVQSAKWGTYKSTLQGVSHLDLVGWVNQARYLWADLTGKRLSFRPVSFYLQLAEDLADEGF